MALEKDEMMLLGRIDGKLDGIKDHMARQDTRLDQFERRVTERLDNMDVRLRDVEKSLPSSAQSAALPSVWVSRCSSKASRHGWATAPRLERGQPWHTQRKARAVARPLRLPAPAHGGGL